jgi:N-acetylmuramoyl-L-alanine amidase
MKLLKLIWDFIMNFFKKKVVEKKEETKMKLTENLLPIGPDRPGTKMSPSSITIHWIGPYSSQTPDVVRSWWMNPSSGQASAHFIVKDKDVMQCIPIDEVAWHAGTPKGNYYSVGIETIPKNTAGEFSEDTILTLKEVCNLIKTKFPEINQVVRHYDWTQKDCPRYYTPITSLLDGGGRVANPEGGDKRWENLKKRIAPWSV